MARRSIRDGGAKRALEAFRKASSEAVEALEKEEKKEQ